MKTSFAFPPQFAWGVATAAAQIEGAASTDGKGRSIWDQFPLQPGAVKDGGNPSEACDHYHRFEEDFALMEQLGIRHYRFSIAWPRLFPLGDGQPNQAGIDFYRRLLDCMLAHGITPWATLYHWDLPQALEDRGGWRVRETVDAFGRYAEAAVQAFHAKIRHWISLNEIPAFIGHGYKLGLHAPGAQEGPKVINQAYHYAMVAHGLAVRAVRRWGGPGAQVGLAHNPEVILPFTETPGDIAAAKAIFAQTNDHILAPMYQGAYPSAYLKRAGADAPQFTAEDMALIAEPTDFLGINVYRGHFARADADGNPELLPLPEAYPRCDPSWLHHTPQAVYWALRFCRELYTVPLFYISENGAGYYEGLPSTPKMPVLHGWPDRAAPATDRLIDLHRCQYLRTYLQSLHRAMADGVPVGGYFLWSFMDNFEWADGYLSRFGLVYVDYATQRRIPKYSADWYAATMRANAVV